jgi:hypothetical protein
MVLWDLEWVDADGTRLHQRQGLNRETAEQHAQHWLKVKPGSRVYLYRHRGKTRVLVQIFAEDAQDGARSDD